jgi:hypothetical protein
VEAGIKAGNLRYAGQTLAYRLDGGKIMRLMQRGKRLELTQFSQNLRRDDCWCSVPDTSVHNAVSDAQHPCVFIPGSQPSSHGVQCAVLIPYIRAEVLLKQRTTISISRRHASGTANPLNLAP